MTRSESKYFATAAKMDEAFLKLLEKKDFEYITVKEICAAAGVNRSTFYLHYETVADLLSESVDLINQQFLDYMRKDSAFFIEQIPTYPLEKLNLMTPEYLVPYLTYVRENKRIIRTAIEKATVLPVEETYWRMYRYVFDPILARFGVPEADRRYLMTFYIHGVMAIITEWMQKDCVDSIEHIISVMQSCIVPVNEKGET